MTKSSSGISSREAAYWGFIWALPSSSPSRRVSFPSNSGRVSLNWRREGPQSWGGLGRLPRSSSRS